MNEMLRIELDPLWYSLSDKARAKASAWAEVARRMEAEPDKTMALISCRRDFRGILNSVGRGTVYRKIKSLRERGLEAVLSKAELRRAGFACAAPSRYPEAFVNWWKGLCGLHQRRKCLSVWRALMRDWLAAGKVIPGYNSDWRGIWLAEHAGGIVPDACPYSDDPNDRRFPEGWSYEALLALAPEQDVWKGVTIGVHAMQAYNPKMPHTRAGLRPMRCITMDDVTLDVFCHYPGERKARRAIGLGLLDVCTAHMVSWILVPLRLREDGTVAKLSGLMRRYIDAHILCHIGIDALEGLIMLLEHGTAGMDEKEEERINKILGPRPDGLPWLKVLRSSTSGSPLFKGMFRERGRGLATFKAMIESAWNLLHNEMAMLTAPSGKDWDHNPRDTEAWAREDAALIKIGAEILAKGCPEAVEFLKGARTHAEPYHLLDLNVRKVIETINHRRGHALEGWEECGFAAQMVDVGGVRVRPEDAVRSLTGGDPALSAALAERVAALAVKERMSPAEAWASFGGLGLKRWDAFTATRILGPELAQRVTVTQSHEIFARDMFSGQKIAYGAVCATERGIRAYLQTGREYDAWVNPFNPNAALVCETDGRFVGAAPYLRATVHGDREHEANLAVLGLFRGEQKRRAEAAAGGKAARETARRQKNTRAVEAAMLAATAPAAPQAHGNESIWADEDDGVPSVISEAY